MWSRPSRSASSSTNTPKFGDLRDLAADDHAGLVGLGDGDQPRVLGELLDAEATRCFSRSTRRGRRTGPVALLKISLGWVTFLVQEMSETWSRPSMPARSRRTPVVGEVADLPLMMVPLGVLLADEFPRVDLGLLHAEGDFLLVLVDLQDDHVDLWPGWTISDWRWLTRRVQDISEMWTRPSMPVRAGRTRVGHDVDHLAGATPTGVLLLDLLPGLASFCLRPGRSSLSRSMLRTLTSIFWPILSSSLGWLIGPRTCR